MNAIGVIEGQITKADELLSHYEATLDQSRQSSRLAVASARARLAELQLELKHEKEQRGAEVVVLRLRDLAYGEMPLRLMAGVAGNLDKAFHGIAKYIHTGKTHGPPPRKLIEQMGLNLAGVGPGSTKLYISGNLSPDLFGRSLLEDSLNSTFKLLRAEDESGLVDAVSSIGPVGARHLGLFAKQLRAANTSVEMLWTSPKDERIAWSADRERISSMVSALAEISTPEPEIKAFNATIISLSLRGVAEIQPDSGPAFRAYVPSKRMPRLKTLRLEDRVAVSIQIDTTVHKATSVEKKRYTLLNIERAT